MLLWILTWLINDCYCRAWGHQNLRHNCSSRDLRKDWSRRAQDANFCNKIIVRDQYIIIHVIFANIGVAGPKMPIFARWLSQIVMWLNEMWLISNIMCIIISWSRTIILLQKLASWARQLQSLQRWHKATVG